MDENLFKVSVLKNVVTHVYNTIAEWHPFLGTVYTLFCSSMFWCAIFLGKAL